MSGQREACVYKIWAGKRGVTLEFYQYKGIIGPVWYMFSFSVLVS